MRAGMLARDFVSFYRIQNIQTESGEITSEKVLIKECRCYVQKQSLSSSNLEVAKELFDQTKLVFQVRFIPGLTDRDVLIYRDEDYRISLIEQNLWDRTLKISAIKLNK